MKWTLSFYQKDNGEKPIEVYLDSLTDKQAAKVLRSMELLEEFGPGIGMPHVENITGNIRCLRVVQSNNIFRVFFFTWIEETLVILNGFTKKTPKTPPREIEKAKQYREDLLNRGGHH